VIAEPVLRTAETAGRAQQVVAPSHGPVSKRESLALDSEAVASKAAGRPVRPLDREGPLSGWTAGSHGDHGALSGIAAIRSCIAPILHGQPELKGTVTATISARDGRISAVNVESGIRHTRLRFCFRQALMSRPVSGGAEEPSFDARVEFFVLPRVTR
jgi:hypothetical protein